MSSAHDRSLLRFVPEPLALTLSLVVVVVAAGIVVHGDMRVVANAFAAGMFQPSQLAFAAQMALVLTTGLAIAEAPPVQRVVAALARWPARADSAAVLVAAVTMGCALLNWGLGVVVGAVCAREVSLSLRARGVANNPGVLGAAGFSGMAVWHGGLSGSAPLKVATSSSFSTEPIPIARTLGSVLNLATTTALVITLIVVLALLARRWRTNEPESAMRAAPPDVADDGDGRVGRVALGIVVGSILVVYAGRQLLQKGSDAVTLDWVLAASTGVGLLAHMSRGASSWGRAMTRGAAEAGAVLVHFPFYFGISAVAVESGLVRMGAEAFASLATVLPAAPQTTAALTTFFSAGLINLVVPSGGGQWAVQGPLIAESAAAMGVDSAPLVMAFAYGDQWTNLVQPFWALPLLSITGLPARALLPATTVCLLACGIVTTITLALFASP